MQKKNFLIIFLLVGLIVFCSGNVLAGNGEIITLKEALTAGLENNTDIVNSKRDVKKSEYDLEIANLSYYPEINVQTTYTRMGEKPVSPINEMAEFIPSIPESALEEPSKDNYNTTLSIRQPLYLGGKARLGFELAEKGVKLSELQNSRKINDVLNKIINNYYNVLQARSMVDIQKNALKVVREHKRIVQANIEAGMAIKSDLLQVKIKERKTEQSLEAARNNFNMAKKGLIQMLNLEYKTVGLKKPGVEPDIQRDLNKLYQQALKHRSELESMKINKEMNETRQKLDGNIYRPSVFLQGTYNWQGEEFRLENGSWNISITASMPLYDGGKANKKEGQYELEKEKIRDNLNNIKEMIRLELENALIKLKEAERKIELQELSIKNARENLEIANKRYKAGVGTNMDVIDAQNQLTQSKISRLQAEYNYKINLFSILYKTGKLKEFCEGVINNEI